MFWEFLPRLILGITIMYSPTNMTCFKIVIVEFNQLLYRKQSFTYCHWLKIYVLKPCEV